MKRRLLFALLSVGVLHAQSASAATCESLASMTLANGHVTSAAMVAGDISAMLWNGVSSARRLSA